MNSGPVVFQDGDYFGRTVNVAARITDYARPGEVLVSDSVASATNGPHAGCATSRSDRSPSKA
jgi:adenylate cyclase